MIFYKNLKVKNKKYKLSLLSEFVKKKIFFGITDEQNTFLSIFIFVGYIEVIILQTKYTDLKMNNAKKKF